MEAPLIDLNYGLGDRIQLKFEFPWVSSESESGAGKPLIGVKWRFVDETTSGLSVSVYPQVEVEGPKSSEDDGLVEPGTELLLPSQFERALGPCSLNLETGYVIREGREDRWITGLALGGHASDALEVIGEIHGESRPRFDGGEFVFNVGFRLDLGESSKLLFSIGRGISADPEFASYLGVQLSL